MPPRRVRYSSEWVRSGTSANTVHGLRVSTLLALDSILLFIGHAGKMLQQWYTGGESSPLGREWGEICQKRRGVRGASSLGPRGWVATGVIACGQSE